MKSRFISLILVISMLVGILSACDVINKDDGVQYIKFGKTEYSVYVGDRLTLDYSVFPATPGGDDLRWSSSDESVAVVAGGIIYGKSEGVTAITAQSSNGVVGSCVIRVVAIGDNTDNSSDNIEDENDNNNNSQFDYLSENLSDYIEMTNDYKNFSISLDIAKPKDIDIDIALLELLASAKTGNGKEYALDLTSREIGPGDIVYIYYRGYFLDDEGNEVVLDGMSNFSDASPYALTIGSGYFVPGFELSMAGNMTSDYTKLEKVTLGGIKNNDELAYVYVSYTRTENADATKTVSVKNERIDLHSDEVALKYGEGFKEWVDLASINDEKGAGFVTTIDGKEYTYTNAKINFATKSEGGESRLVECYFPYNYGKEELRNETAYFEVYVQRFVDYDAPELDDEFIREQIESKKIKISEDVLNTYDGDTLVGKYREYVKKQFLEQYEKEYNALFCEKVFSHFKEISNVIKYPKSEVDKFYNEYYKSVENSYFENDGYFSNGYMGVQYHSLDTYAVAYFGLASGSDWTAHVRELAEYAVKERLVLYYIVSIENLTPESDAEFNKKVEDTKEKILEEYILQYLSHMGMTKEDYKDDYDAFVAERLQDIMEYYTDEYFEELTYYNLLMERAQMWVYVITMDDHNYNSKK